MAQRPNPQDKESPVNGAQVDSSNPPAPEGEKKEQKSMPAYLKAALRLSTSYPLGAKSTDTNISTNGIDLRQLKPIPGYMVLNYVPTLGVSDSSTSAVNRAAFNEFNAIRSQISGNRSYEPSDHMIYRACVDGMRDLFHYARRIYGIIRKYSATNMYRPIAALEAMGLDADDWRRNAADLYQWLLSHRGALAPFPTVPIGNISKRHDLFNTYMFTDGSIDSVQTYIMNQCAFWSYENVDEVRGITVRKFPSTFSEFTQMWDEMYAALQGSSDVYIIAADIRRAFADKVVTDLPDTPADYTVEYVELDPIKCSIMNALILGTDVTNGDFDYVLDAFKITDDLGIIKCNPRFQRALGNIEVGTSAYLSVMLNHVNSVSAEPDEVALLNTLRLKPVVANSDEEGGQYVTEIISMGTEVVVSAYICGFDTFGAIENIPVSTLVYSKVAASPTGAGYYNALGKSDAIARAISNFDWHPPVLVAAVRSDGYTESKALIEDVQNYIPISNTALTSIHEANLLAEFGLE